MGDFLFDADLDAHDDAEQSNHAASLFAHHSSVTDTTAPYALFSPFPGLESENPSKSKVDSDKEIIPCPIVGCTRRYTTRAGLRYHMKTQHGGVNNTPIERVRFQCEHCPKSFEAKSSLTSHMQVHNPPTPLVCDFCGETFNRKNALAKHRVIHIDCTCISNKVPGLLFLCVSCEVLGISCVDGLFFSSFFFPHCFLVAATLPKMYEPILDREEEDDRSFPCNHPNCGRSFLSESGLLYHKNVVHATTTTDHPLLRP
eukprot:m.128405 g.128405  ORF g.128405 m.128405 type:complete len:257 (+) comp52293_c0_seq3:165-935(+)